jgi:hypothetical protein
MLITYTVDAVRFAQAHEGLPALHAKVEHELDTMRDLGIVLETDEVEWGFMWQGAYFSIDKIDGQIVIDIEIEDDGEGAEVPITPTNQEPDAAVVPALGEQHGQTGN